MLSQAIQTYVEPFGTMVGKGHQGLVPNSSMDLFYLGLQAFDYMPSGKNGCRGIVKKNVFKNHVRSCWLRMLSLNLGSQTLPNIVPAVYPSNYQFIAHFPEFLANGYRPALGSINVKFQHKGDRLIQDFSVGYVDGQCKVLCMIGVVALCHQLEFGEKELSHEQLKMVLSSFTSVQCTFEHYNNPAQYYLQSLRTLSNE